MPSLTMCVQEIMLLRSATRRRTSALSAIKRWPVWLHWRGISLSTIGSTCATYAPERLRVHTGWRVIWKCTPSIRCLAARIGADAAENYATRTPKTPSVPLKAAAYVSYAQSGSGTVARWRTTSVFIRRNDRFRVRSARRRSGTRAALTCTCGPTTPSRRTRAMFARSGLVAWARWRTTWAGTRASVLSSARNADRSSRDSATWSGTSASCTRARRSTRARSARRGSERRRGSRSTCGSTPARSRSSASTVVRGSRSRALWCITWGHILVNCCTPATSVSTGSLGRPT